MASVEGATHANVQAGFGEIAGPTANDMTFEAGGQLKAAAEAEAAAGGLQEPAADEDPGNAEAAPEVASSTEGAEQVISAALPAVELSTETVQTDTDAIAGTATPEDPMANGASTAAAAPAPAPASAAVIEDSSTPVSQSMRHFSQQQNEQAAAALSSPGRSSSTAAPPWAAAPAAASSIEAALIPPVIHASSSDKALQDTPAVNVRELREQLSATRIPLTAQMAPPPKPPSPQPKPQPALPVSEHDKVNTVNAAALLASAEFNKVPGQDVIPYEDLVGLRLEDGIDVTRKEDYLSADDFTKVFGCDREAYAQMPNWKRLQIKRSVKLF